MPMVQCINKNRLETKTIAFEATLQQGISLECCHHTEITRTSLVAPVTENKLDKIAKFMVVQLVDPKTWIHLHSGVDL